MSTPSRRRLMRDLKRLESDNAEGFTAAPTPNNLMVWNAVIFGPEGTPYEDGTFHLTLTFDETYPNNPPKCKFQSVMFHPNIYNDGNICLDILQNRWSPTYDVAALLTSIQSLLPDPNPSSAANSQAASLFNSNRASYEVRVKETVEKSWKYKVPGSKEAVESSSEDLDSSTSASVSDSASDSVSASDSASTSTSTNVDVSTSASVTEDTTATP